MKARVFLQRLPGDPVFALSVSVIYASAIAWVDYSTDYELRFGVLYVPAVFLASWGAGRVAGIGIGVAVAATWIATLFLKYPYASASLHLWEGAFHLLMYVAFALMTARLKEALLLAEERFVSAFDSLDASACVIDAASGALLYANPQFARTFDGGGTASAAELARRFGSPVGSVGSPVGSVGSPVGPVGSSLGSVASPAASGSDLPSGDCFDVDSGRWYYVFVRAMRWLDGRLVLLHVASDITEAKRAEQVARQQEEQLQRTARLIAVGEMASTLAHELNQPLGAIANYNNGAIRLLKSWSAAQDGARQGGAPKADELISLMEKCSAQALRAGEVVHRIREFVRKRPPELRPESPYSLVAEAVSLAEGEAHAAAAPDIRVEVPAGLPQVHADRTMVAKVMLNLARNAMDAMAGLPRAERCLSLRAVAREERVEFQFADCGSGVPADMEKRLFQPFLSTKPDGMGLGLAICRSIVEYHRGELWFTRNPEAGSTFHFTLPVAR